MRNHWRCHWGVKRPEFRSTTFNLHDLKKSSDFNVIVLMLNTGLRSAHCREIWKSKDTLSMVRFISTNVQSLSCQCCRVENEDAADSGHKEQVMIMDSFFSPNTSAQPPSVPLFCLLNFLPLALSPSHNISCSSRQHSRVAVQNRAPASRRHVHEVMSLTWASFLFDKLSKGFKWFQTHGATEHRNLTAILGWGKMYKNKDRS